MHREKFVTFPFASFFRDIRCPFGFESLKVDVFTEVCEPTVASPLVSFCPQPISAS